MPFNLKVLDADKGHRNNSNSIENRNKHDTYFFPFNYDSLITCLFYLRQIILYIYFQVIYIQIVILNPFKFKSFIYCL